jgi:hypothetical protein
MRAHLAPVPIRKIGEFQYGVVSADGTALLRTDTIDDDIREARAPIDQAVPVAKPSCWFSTPRHAASKLMTRLSANRAVTSQGLGIGAGASYCRSRVLISRAAGLCRLITVALRCTRPGSKEFYPEALIFGMDIALGRCPKIGVMVRMDKTIRCPQCGSLMRLALAPGDKGPRSLRCEQCERPDPFTAGEVSGWLKGELRPPTCARQNETAGPDPSPRRGSGEIGATA